MSEHSWCQNIPRDEAVRAAEDGRQGPLPTLEDVIARPFANTQGTCEQSAPAPPFAQPAKCSPAVSETGETQSRLRTERVTERRPPEPGGGGNVTGLRTERVTLEVTHDLDAPLREWIVQVIDESLGFDESVRVVDNTAERITQALTADRFASAVQEADRLRSRVAELESAAKLAPAANAAAGSNHAAPAASDAAGTEAAEIARLREERRWVPVGERLPTVQGDDVLTARGPWEDGGYSIVRGWWNGECWMFYSSDRDSPPVAFWQPLPPGPEAK